MIGEDRPSSPEGRRRWLLPLALSLALLTLLGLLTTITALDLSESALVEAGQARRQWLAKAITGQAWGAEAINASWGAEPTALPGAEIVTGLFQALTGWALGPLAASRLASAALTALLMMAIYLLLSTTVSRRAGLGAALALLGTPAFVVEATSATGTIIEASVLLLATLAFLQGQRDWRRGLGAALLMGLALITSAKGIYLMMGLVAWSLVREMLWPTLPEPAPEESSSSFVRLPPLPLPVLQACLLAPLLALALWPHLWSEPLTRLEGFVTRSRQLEGAALLYEGHLYQAERPPWTAPVTVVVEAVPASTLALAAIGCLALLPWARRRLGGTAPLVRAAAILLPALILLRLARGPWDRGGASALMEAFPLIAILAGAGLDRVLAAAGRLTSLGARPRSLLLAGLATLCLAPGLIASATMIKGGLYRANGLMGGVQGAVEAGRDRTLGERMPLSMVDWLNERAPKGATVAFEPQSDAMTRTVALLQSQGRLRPDIKVDRPSQASLTVLLHIDHWDRLAEIVNDHRRDRVLAQIKHQGVPLATILSARGRKKP